MITTSCPLFRSRRSIALAPESAKLASAADDRHHYYRLEMLDHQALELRAEPMFLEQDDLIGIQRDPDSSSIFIVQFLDASRRAAPRGRVANNCSRLLRRFSRVLH